MQSVHKIPTIIVLSFLIHAKKKESLKYVVLSSHTYTDALPHSFNQKSITPLKVQMEISTDNSDQLSELKSVSWSAAGIVSLSHLTSSFNSSPDFR